MNVVSAVFLVVFAVIGICAFVRELTFFIFRNRKNNTVMFVAPISGKCENAEYILRSAARVLSHSYVRCVNISDPRRSRGYNHASERRYYQYYKRQNYT